MTAKLSIFLPGQRARTIPLQGALTIGRGASSDLVLESVSVSRGHALLRPLGRGNYFLLDLGSANGTFLNGRLVTAPVKLNDGDTIMIADCTLVFEGFTAQRAPTAPTAEYKDTMKTATISILVVDIRNFTHLSEALPAKELPAFIGGWFRDASAVIERHGGTIDKFIGDAVMSYWLPSAEMPSAIVRGPVESALELVDLASGFHDQLSAAHPKLSFSVGCGIHMGEAMFGVLGTSSRHDFTAIGDCVNVAFRLESQCKELHKSIIVSEQIQQGAADAYIFEDLGPLTLKGKSNVVHGYAVKGKAAL